MRKRGDANQETSDWMGSYRAVVVKRREENGWEGKRGEEERKKTNLLLLRAHLTYE